MTPPARAQAAIELLDRILVAAREGGAAADTLISRYFAERRYAGSKDRRAVRELVYAAIRRAGEPPVSGRAALLGLAQDDPGLPALFDGGAHAPAPIAAGEPSAFAGVAPAWLEKRLSASGLSAEERAALVGRAPLDLRVNRLRPGAVDLPEAEPISGLPDALRLPTGFNVERTHAWGRGLIEVQDAGSQLVTLATGAAPGDRVIDLCAGGGGKTLALASMMQDRGSILATDTDRNRLQRLPARADRAGVTLVTSRLLDPGKEREQLEDQRGTADVVLVDAPCSGTGTWRRNPEARWRLTPDRLDRLVATQARLLDLAAELVRPGGALVHVVCSLLDAEGRDQATAFLQRQRGWNAASLPLPLGRTHGDGVRLTPAHDGADGFFVARLVAPC